MIGVKLHEPLQEAIENAMKVSALSDDDMHTLETALATKCVNSSALKVLKYNSSNRKGVDLMKILQGSNLLFPHTNIKKAEQVKVRHRHNYNALHNLNATFMQVSIDYSIRKQYLQRKDEERQYNEMVYGNAE